MAARAIRSVIIDATDPSLMRYHTAGDWVFLGDELAIEVADTGDWRYNCLLAIHELIEVLLCTSEGISQKTVDRFDFAHQDDDDPGSDPKAPYARQHLVALGIEMVLCASLDIPWRIYEEAVETTLQKTPVK